MLYVFRILHAQQNFPWTHLQHDDGKGISKIIIWQGSTYNLHNNLHEELCKPDTGADLS